ARPPHRRHGAVGLRALLQRLPEAHEHHPRRPRRPGADRPRRPAARRQGGADRAPLQRRRPSGGDPAPAHRVRGLAVTTPAPADPPGFSIRPCVDGDEVTLANLIRELAVYERLERYARATPADLRTHLFGPRPAAEAVLAEVGGEAVGYALYFPTFSTFRGQPRLYLENLFVRPQHRRRRIGQAPLAPPA